MQKNTTIEIGEDGKAKSSAVTTQKIGPEKGIDESMMEEYSEEEESTSVCFILYS